MSHNNLKLRKLMDHNPKLTNRIRIHNREKLGTVADKQRQSLSLKLFAHSGAAEKV